MTGSSPQCLPVDTVIAINKQQARGRVCLFDYGGFGCCGMCPFLGVFWAQTVSLDLRGGCGCSLRACYAASVF